MKIIAEIGQNHNGDMGLAQELIASAKESGADVAKFQLYDANNLFPRKDNPWFEYNCKTELSRKDLEKIDRYCCDIGIEFMASAFDVERVLWLEELNVKQHKLASRSINDQDLINAIAITGKPVLVSLGMWESELFPELPIDQVGYLHCISKYPTPLDEIHLGDIDFSKYKGFSDHSIGVSASIAALALGANVIEKHFTLDKKLYGPDHEGSMTPDELLLLSRTKDDFQLCL